MVLGGIWSWFGTESAGRWLLNFGLVLASFGAACAFMSQVIDVDDERGPEEWFGLIGAFSAAIGTGLGSFGVSALGQGTKGYIPTIALGVLLVLVFASYECLRRRRAAKIRGLRTNP
jgi:hypothetical protein